MKKLIIISLFVLVGNAAFGASGVYVKFNAPLFSYVETQQKLKYYVFNLEFSRASSSEEVSFLSGSGLSIGYDFNDVFAAEASYSRTKIDSPSSWGTLGYKTARNVFELTGITRVVSYKSFDFNVVGSAGYINYYGPSYNMNGFSFGIGAQAEYNLSENAALALDIRYLHSNEESDKDWIAVDRKANGAQLSASLKYRF
ncbi:MAG: porin family protein [Bacteroidales bacterium]|jgi:opacity protein-like surface antigen|nr:porin family protein [Bacteroidales bacterium]